MQLEEKNLVIRVKHPSDKRAYWLELSQTGRIAAWNTMNFPVDALI